jgi:aspartate ammonia-lyase
VQYIDAAYSWLLAKDINSGRHNSIATRNQRDEDHPMTPTAVQLKQSPATSTAERISHTSTTAKAANQSTNLRSAHSPSTRIEHDCIGAAKVPAHVYWGIHTLRAIENFPISGVPVSSHPEIIHAYATIKRACARANRELGGIDARQGKLIDQACADVQSGRFNDQFPIDVLQGGAGTSTNMNTNEVIANRALELGGYARGDYRIIHPNDDVNKSQSTNDTYPAAARLALITALGGLVRSTHALGVSFSALSQRTMDQVKLGRTQLQDAVPMTFGQEFAGFASVLEQDAQTLCEQQRPLATLNLGGTAIGTGICADTRFRDCVSRKLIDLTDLPIRQASNPIAATSDVGDFVMTSSVIKRTALHLGKIANDIRLLCSGPRAGLAEITIPAKQAGSSIMPGKINPVIPESVNQSVFMIMGMDTTVAFAAEAGQLQLNAFEPVMLHTMLNGIHILANAMDTLRRNCVEDIQVNERVGLDETLHCASLATSLIGHIGYEKAVQVAKTSLSENITVHQAALREGSIRPEILDDILDPHSLAHVR